MTPKNRKLEGDGGSKIIRNRRKSLMDVPQVVNLDILSRSPFKVPQPLTPEIKFFKAYLLDSSESFHLVNLFSLFFNRPIFLVCQNLFERAELHLLPHLAFSNTWRPIL